MCIRDRSKTVWPGPRPTSMPSFILIRPTVWPQYTNVTDRQDRRDRQWSDSIGRTVLQTVAQKSTDFNAVFVVRFMNERHKWRHKFYRPYLTGVATLPYESLNTQNLILQRNITKENCIIISSSKWTRVMCLKFSYLGMLYTAMRVRNKDSWHRWPAITLGENLVWQWTGHYQRCDWPLTWPSEITSACWWWTFWIHALKRKFIKMTHHSVLWNCQCNLMHLMAIL